MKLEHSGSFGRCIHHFTVVRLVVWPLNESEAGVDLEKCEVPLDLESGKIHQVSNIICPDQKSIS